MEKQKYEKPEMEIQEFEIEDIMSSGNNEGEGDFDFN
ncbi:hypothetical protein SAMN04488579_107112 [Eubacterium barkeri]|uniref:Uncharacterized protein n=1 Tax=Eubacterium barkeri TaxID=1528 RepID=A0A1H3EN11_EUBBA|nr:hypothetical protein SAMN04488579_107112 [Eubacterium barkeri]